MIGRTGLAPVINVARAADTFGIGRMRRPQLVNDVMPQLLQAFIVGGQIEKAEAVLVKVPEAEDRLYLIGVPLLKLAGALLPSILRDRTP